ncbi:multiple C2 and transmembrane domain-containing protein isoform X1 [Drosophila nasuta]|uniref:Multiple C2 and transmembrane domain-containing protein isoform X1 n=1 Tax=Drosophila albomicans TaxID=7291 RepID=A0A6P8WRF9_DROAB|nr:multiple C2 and transmembrane domain-containing protein isoform X1 [Drosophila albomicans]XP_060654013.1 multiple C2 and transmembrane domain-containing protein isoform X1 [Drosophila nasuta]
MQTKPTKRHATFALCHRINKIFPVVAARIHYVEREERPCSSSSRLAAGGSIDVSANASPPSGVGISPQGSPQLQQRLGKHLSKSASELNGHDCHSNESPHISPKRAKSAASQQLAGGIASSGATGGSGGSVASGAGVLQKTHGFFNNLRHRWSRAKSKDRIGRKSPSDFLEESTDYAADYSSESSSVTQSPRHRATTIIGGSPLARDFRATAKMAQVIQRFGGSMEGRIDEQPENGNGHVAMVSSSASAQQQLDALQADELRRKREAQLRQFVFFQLRVHLKSGCDLVAMDKNGLSDPYVKFKVGGRLLHKSRTIHRDLNPVWDEVFIVPVEDPFQPIIVKVFDYDWGLQDDFMGSAKIDLTQLELGKAEDINLQLSDTNNGEPGLGMGEILINLTLWPRSQEDKEMHFQRNSKLAESSKRLKSQIWSSVVTILLVKAKDLPLAEDGNKLIDTHFKFRLGNEKYKTKSSWTERWLEQFDLHLFDEDQNLELALWNRNTLFGKANIDLSVFQRENTHGIWKPLEDCSGEVFLMLTISGTTALETISDLKAFKEDPRETQQLRDRYRFLRSLQNLRDVGHLTVKVFGATGLAAADIGGKSDPFCVLELGNARLQTQTEYKTLTPNWNKIFTFNVKDITQVLEVTVFDEDRDHRVEFLGKLVIPLLRIKSGVKRWYTLKDKNLCVRAKGNSPQIQLELTVVWNEVRAVCRALQPKEEKLIQQEAKFKRQLFLRNVNRLKEVIMDILEAARYVQSCFEWESPVRSSIAFVLWIVACVYGDLETVPLVLLLIILKKWLIRLITGTTDANAGHYDYDYDEDDDDDKEKEEKKSIKERLQAIQEVSQTVQNTIGYLASLAESTINTFNFSVPELTWLAVVLLLGAIFVLHFVPLRWLLLFWGFMKFSRRILRPNTIPNNELLDFLSRVPDNEAINQFRELPPSAPTDQARNNPKKKLKGS